ncbi:hypothetical protein SLS63_003293 [Diaporthe eres]|uniref:Short chain dehydrogenase/reductase family oxidoreductase n=1 Tax=Diaporthe eres TaxID=83184 RepID=A0ABR1PGG8_DIAER
MCCKVVIGDVNVEQGKSLEAELAGTKFVKCDTTSDDQEPSKPDLSITDVNITGTLYTAKLAFHYFVKQNGTEPSPAQQDTCLVLIGSGAAFLDCPRGPQYSASKWAARGIMHSLRRTAHYYGSRVNIISPWYVRTNILSEEAFRNVAGVGVEFATTEDAGRCLLRILADSGVNGHSFFVCARKWAPETGFVDLGIDEYDSELIQEIQRDQLLSAPVEAGLFIDPYERGKKAK